MGTQEKTIIDQIEGLEQVDENELAEFKREMTERVIPEITRIVEKRRLLAAESRYREMQLPSDQSPAPSE